MRRSRPRADRIAQRSGGFVCILFTCSFGICFARLTAFSIPCSCRSKRGPSVFRAFTVQAASSCDPNVPSALYHYPEIPRHRRRSPINIGVNR
ncbi:hypothetical protein QBC36DRAFT_35081 [Triangularia setosa]|uniref:Uncharacterized protein n=1 Tax=Triangularia setosa TaxID=2587417 RepID=A0AAN6W3W3_9PEZI|nr:hypothetical protein QBC36DRAFT_35081 [Podospora setosa]